MPLFETLYHTFKHSWDDISLASWMKYPSPERPDVLSVDIIEKHYDPETGILRCKRLMICKDHTPAWLKAILGSTEYFFVEDCEVDPRQKKMVLTSKNINFANILGVEEVCTYVPDPLNDQFTLFKQEAKITSSVFGVARKMESFCLDKFKKNSTKGRGIMEEAIQRAEALKLDAEESFKDIEESIDKAISSVKKEAEESFKDIEHTFDKAVDCVHHYKHEAEESLSRVEETIDKVLQEVKHEAEDSLALIDKVIANVNKEKEVIFNLDKVFKSWRAETETNLGEEFKTFKYQSSRKRIDEIN
ncbi:slowmo family protein [Cavenderia fasciculata]|uniref:Slowmo family protein n=1 Tax=Cavenderia fasciculata TaxID=261658 RepID=F4Q665_CACFS|nr:slowmo family protein [Cavenderia fasciculata]EGG17439.1 slowmo family protein [Cavenderia fasciculata]|eukprot:XP_004355923.1 slowmo family protein [Cavenderia fasciculata]